MIKLYFRRPEHKRLDEANCPTDDLHTAICQARKVPFLKRATLVRIVLL